MKTQYDEAITILWRSDVTVTEAEAASDLVVRHGMFLDPDYVRVRLATLIASAPTVTARREVMDFLADYDVPLCEGLYGAVRGRFCGDNGEFLTALYLILRNTPRDVRRDLVADMIRNGEITPDRQGLANRALVRLESE